MRWVSVAVVWSGEAAGYANVNEPPDATMYSYPGPVIVVPPFVAIGNAAVAVRLVSAARSSHPLHTVV